MVISRNLIDFLQNDLQETLQVGVKEQVGVEADSKRSGQMIALLKIMAA